MYIQSLAHYLPEEVVPNSYFLNVNGLDDEWIYQRTGIKNRRKASKEETTNTMASEVCAKLNKNNSLEDVDLIVGASYTPHDTVGTMSHFVQREFNIKNAKSVYVSSACSSFINAVEIVEGYFATGKSKKALVVASEHNTAYSNENDDKSGHLWGDGAAACIITKEEIENGLNYKIIDIKTIGLGHLGRGIDGVYLTPKHEGIVMPYGKDVFLNAIVQMGNISANILKDNNLDTNDLSYLIPHQANARIIEQIRKNLELDSTQVLTNIEEAGNTGCASAAIVLSENHENFNKNEYIVMSVFGGGYSCGSILLQV